MGTTMAVTRAGASALRTAILGGARWSNTTASLRGAPLEHPGAVPGTGRLEPDWSGVLRRDEPDYAIYSYATPIAWRSQRGHWRIPPESYSRTTSRHQKLIRAALTPIPHAQPHPGHDRLDQGARTDAVIHDGATTDRNAS
jgi:hypothetical protein